MPNITEFEAGDLAIRPSEAGVEAHQMAGRRIGVSYNETAAAYGKLGAELGKGIANVGDTAVNYMDHQQINAGADKFSGMYANLQDSLNKTLQNADPQDPTVVKRWRENVVEPTLDQFAQGFTTQKSQDWANSKINELRQHLYIESEGAMSHIAGVAAENRINNSVRNYSNGVVANPNSVDFAVKSYKDHLEDTLALFPNLKGEDAAKVREEIGEKGTQQIVQSAVMGAIMNGGNWRGIASKYPDYVSGAEMLQFEKAQKVQDRANLAYSKQAEAYQMQIDRENVDKARNDIWTKNVTIDPQTGQPTIAPDFFKQAVQIPAKYPNAPNATDTARTLLDWGEGVQEGRFNKTVTDPKVYGDLNSGLFAAEKPTTDMDVLKAEVAKTVSHSDGEAIRNLIKVRDEQPIKDPVFKDTMQSVKDTLSIGTADDPLGSKSYARFVQLFFPEYQKELREGTLKPNALNMADPTSLISQSIAAGRASLQEVYTRPTPSATPGVSAAPPVSLPPLKDRKSGQQYMTGRGLMTWTGTGWVAPQASPAQPQVPIR